MKITVAPPQKEKRPMYHTVKSGDMFKYDERNVLYLATQVSLISGSKWVLTAFEAGPTPCPSSWVVDSIDKEFTTTHYTRVTLDEIKVTPLAER
jgi:hypothetical protein